MAWFGNVQRYLLRATLVGTLLALMANSANAAANPNGISPSSSNPSLLLAPPSESLLPPELLVTVRAPDLVVKSPYIILTGFASSSDEPIPLILRGRYDVDEFQCDESPCALEISRSGRVVFYAQTPAGKRSKELTAEIEVRQVSDGYRVRVLTQGNFTFFQDRCNAVWQIDPSNLPYWATFPQDPAELNTRKDLFNLSANLMRNQIVDTSACPNGGWLGNGPNACALELLRPELQQWQNQYDLSIWLAGRENGIPPVLLKTLIEVESQFWPITQRQFLDELGLAQINQLGIDVLLRTDAEFYRLSCADTLYDCSLPYASQPPLNQQLLRGVIAKRLDADCPTCDFGISRDLAGNSVGLIGKVLYANCVQTNKFLGSKKANISYEDAWKLTLATYHSGYGCVLAAITTTNEEKKDLTWENVASNMECVTARPYVDKFFAALYLFDNSLVDVQSLKFYQPKPAAVKPSAPITSSGRVEVLVYMDTNNNGTPEPDEFINNVTIELKLSTGESFRTNTLNGKASFDLTGLPIGITATVRLPSLFRSATITVPASGTIPLTFVFAAPSKPTPQP